MNKKLKNTTIVDQSLYVEREADRQLANAIGEMGRPPYILVARQMGKTNLLFNAKRKLCGDGDAFVYIDLSNKFESSRECFREIINIAVATHPFFFDGIEDEIISGRNKLIAPHKEHEFELRKLLSSISGKLVIMLDEIDSLTNCDYSDQVFAQIRSTYFSRINFPEYNRLTYVLSGVAEPNEIIKDKNISPFNIGEKIYLDDFSKSEYIEFVNRSQLSFPIEVINRIFEWANGNPRITWDICSEIEANQIAGIKLVPETVDKVVKKLYLTEYDKAPVDHIRDIVEANFEIRDAIIQINYNKGSVLSDDIKKSLYLAGIIKADYESENVKIKNKVILECLSESWLQSLEIKQVDVLKLAKEENASGNYLEAAMLYSKYIKENPEKSKEDYIYNSAGIAYYNAKEYEKALEYLEKSYFDKNNYSYTPLYYNEVYIKGICNYILGNYNYSIKYFQEVYESCRDNKLKYYSAINLAGSYQKKDFNQYSESVFQIYDDVRSALASSSTSFEEKDYCLIKQFTLFNLSQAYLSEGTVDKAKEVLREVLDICDEKAKPQILMQLYLQESDNESKLSLLRDIKDIIVSGNLELSEPSFDQPLLLTPSIYTRILICAISAKENEIFEDLYKYAVVKCQKVFKSEIYLLYLTATLAINKNPDIAKKLLEKALTLEIDDDDIPTKFECYKIAYPLGTVASSEQRHVEFYFNCLLDESIDLELTKLDINICHSLISEFILKNDYKKALSYIDRFEISRLRESEVYKKIFFFMNCYAFICHQNLRNTVEGFDVARTIVASVDCYPELFQDIGEFCVIVKAARNFIYGPPPEVETKIRRNEKVRVKYKNGAVKEGKFKKFKRDIEMRVCEIV